MKLLTLSLLIITIASFSACRKVIQVDLRNAPTKYVIAGNINDQPGPYTIKITTTKAFNTNNEFPYVSGATVVVSDNDEITDTLRETAPGIYNTNIITGTPGHNYKMLVKIGNSKFTASSTMPQPVALDSVYIISREAFGEKGTYVVPVYKDPISKGDNYHFIQYVNDTVSKDIFVIEDRFINGTKIEIPLDGETEIRSGDKVRLTMQTIDQNVYNYYYSFSINQNVATPANPVTNITGGALGYFSANCVSYSKTITAP